MSTAVGAAPPRVASRDADRQAEHEALRFAHEILPAVSRTFAISIRLLPGTLGRAVLTAYLLCRIADTIEDDGTAAPDTKDALLDQLLRCLDDPDDVREVASFVAASAVVRGEAAHVRLLRHLPLVLCLFARLPDATRAHVRRWVGEMVVGMREFVRRYPRGIRIQTLAEYQEYCYYVAGTVGYLLTDLWREHSGSIGAPEFARLRVRCLAFGRALQSVNILKDIAWDAEHENAIYIPEQTLAEHGSGHRTLLDPVHLAANHAAVSRIIELARQDLDEALEYVCDIPHRAFSIRAFCVLPLLFAYATLRDLSRSQAMLRVGGTVKISRAEVRVLLMSGMIAVLLGSRATRWLVTRVRARPLTVVAPRPA